MPTKRGANNLNSLKRQRVESTKTTKSCNLTKDKKIHFSPHETHWHEFSVQSDRWTSRFLCSRSFHDIRKRRGNADVNSSRAARLSVHELRPVRGAGSLVISRAIPFQDPFCAGRFIEDNGVAWLFPRIGQRTTIPSYDNNEATSPAANGGGTTPEKKKRTKRTFHSVKIFYTWQSLWIRVFSQVDFLV